MKRTIVFSMLVASLLFSIGCSSSYEVSSSPNADPSFNTFNTDANDRSGVIVFQDGRELQARNIVASPDTTRFLNGKTGAITLVPTHTINKVVLTNRAVGFLEGFGWGALAGSATVLALIETAWPKGEFDTGEVTGFVLLGGAVGGGVIGGIPGLIIGHSYEYQFVTSEESTKIK